MFKSLLSASLLAVVTTPVYSPSAPYEIVNNSSATLVWVNKANDMETYIQPYSAISVERLTGFALSCYETSVSSNLLFSVDKGSTSDRYYTKDVDYFDNLYTDFMNGDTKVSVYDSYFSGDVYLDFSNLNTNPFSEDFYYMFGLNESNYVSMSSAGLFRTSTIFTGNFNIYGDLPSAYNVQYSSLVAFASVWNSGKGYKKENIKAQVSLFAVRSNSLRAVQVASNYTTGDYEVVHVPQYGTFLDGYNALMYSGGYSASQFRSMQFNSGISNNIWSAGFNVGNPQSAQFLTYRKTALPSSSTQTEDALDDFFSLMAKALSVLIPFLGVVVLPGVTIGLLLFIPLFVALIIALIKMIKK